MMNNVILQLTGWLGEPMQERERINCHHGLTEHPRGKWRYGASGRVGFT